jgi:hypothetical protein
MLIFYHQQLLKKDHENAELKKRLKMFTMQEKKILVKEKAFEIERSAYFVNLVNLEQELKQERVKGSEKRQTGGFKGMGYSKLAQSVAPGKVGDGMGNSGVFGM